MPFLRGVGQFMQGFEMLLPFLCVLLAAVSFFETKSMKTWYAYLLGAWGVLAVGAILFSGLEQLLVFIMFYFVLVICFDAWERLLGASKEFTSWSGILFGGLLLRGIYLLMELMSAYR